MSSQGEPEEEAATAGASAGAATASSNAVRNYSRRTDACFTEQEIFDFHQHLKETKQVHKNKIFKKVPEADLPENADKKEKKPLITDQRIENIFRGTTKEDLAGCFSDNPSESTRRIIERKRDRTILNGRRRDAVYEARNTVNRFRPEDGNDNWKVHCAGEW
jgi:hypothetical protein